MALLPQPSHTTVVKIYEHYEKANAAFKPRPHLGASIIGKECRRALWYDFRWATKAAFIGRILRLFESGNREEFRVLVDLKNAGVTVHEKDPETGKQFQFKDLAGHFSGSMDAAMQGLEEAPKTWHVGECKTHNLKSFTALVKDGVKKSKPLHWHQMNTYMGWSGMKRAAYFAICKDTDDIYLERVEFDKEEFERDRVKANAVITAPEPLTKINNDPAWFECKFCDHHPVCHAQRVPMKSCRTCAHSTPNGDLANKEGVWDCDKHKKKLTYEEQVAGCPNHVFIPALVAYAEPQEAGDNWIAYRNKRNNKLFVNTSMPVSEQPDLEKYLVENSILTVYSSDELHACDPAFVGDLRVDDLKAEMGATVIPQPEIKSDATA
jgi:hypothetical protein